MNARQVGALSAVLGLLILASILVWRSDRPRRPIGNPLEKVSPADIEKIDIVAGSTVTLVQAGGRWKLAAPVGDFVDPAASVRLVEMVRNFTIGSVVSENPGRHDQFLVNASSATRLTVTLRNGATPIDLLVGKPTSDLESSFIRVPGHDEVRTGDGLSGFLIRNDVSTFRDPAVVPIRGADLTGLTATWKSGGVTLSRSSATWSLDGGRALTSTEIETLLSKVSELAVADFGKAPALAGSDFDATFSSGTDRFHVWFGPAPRKGETNRLVQVDGRPTVLLVPDAAVSAFLSFLQSLR